MYEPKYAKQCWDCNCAGICFKWLELAGDITHENQPIMPGKCGEIRKDPETGKAKNRLEVIKRELKLNPAINLRICNTGLNYNEFRSMYYLKRDKYSNLTTDQLKLLSNKVLYRFQDQCEMQAKQWEEKIREIKKQFRLFMNGVVSQSMREKGLDYKLNFGIELPRLKEIAEKFEKNHEVAQALWKENIRECKILAGLLQPIDTFYPEIADIWVEDMRYPEIAELTCMNLFQHLPYASEKAFEWMADEREYFQFCGYMLMTRLLMKGNEMNERAENEFVDQAITALQGETGIVCRAASTALRKYASQSPANARKLLKILQPMAASGKPEVLALAEDVKLEAESLR